MTPCSPRPSAERENLGRYGDKGVTCRVASSFRPAGIGRERSIQAKKKPHLVPVSNKLMPDCDAGHESRGRCSERFFFFSLSSRVLLAWLALGPYVGLSWKCRNGPVNPHVPIDFAMVHGQRDPPTGGGGILVAAHHI